MGDRRIRRVYLTAEAERVAQAQQPSAQRGIARVTGLQGNVLVSQADGMAAAQMTISF